MPGARDTENAELLINGNKVSVLHDEQVLEILLYNIVSAVNMIALHTYNVKRVHLMLSSSHHNNIHFLKKGVLSEAPD